MSDTEHIAKILIKYRKNYYQRKNPDSKKTLSQGGLYNLICELSKKDPNMSVSLATIKNIESQKVTPQDSTLSTLATALEIPVDMFYITDEARLEELYNLNEATLQEKAQQEHYNRLTFDEKLPIYLAENHHTDIIPLLDYLRHNGYIVDFEIDKESETLSIFKNDTAIRTKKRTEQLSLTQLESLVGTLKMRMRNIEKKLSSPKISQSVANKLDEEYQEYNAKLMETNSRIEYLKQHDTISISTDDLKRYAKAKILERGNPYNISLDDMPINVKIYQGVAIQDEHGELHQRTEPFRTMSLYDFVKLCDSISHIVKTIIEV